MEKIESFYNILTKGHSPMVDDWFLMKSPLPAIGIVLAYLYFVLRAGPRMMQNRKPMELKVPMILYNASQVIFSIYLCAMAVSRSDVALQVFTLGCRTNVTVTAPMYKMLYTGAYWYYIGKMIELLDTVFFILRKNQRQVTFLHVYHHSIMVLWAYYYLKYAFGEQGVAIGFINSFVHVIMYTYYMLAAMGPQMKKYLWWKKYITALQLVQFCTILVVLGVTSVINCNVPPQVTVILAFLSISFLILFSRFYIQSYTKPAAQAPSPLSASKCVDSNNNLSPKEMKKLK